MDLIRSIYSKDINGVKKNISQCNDRDILGRTPIFHAILNYRDSLLPDEEDIDILIFRLLLENTDLTIRDNNGLTPSIMAATSNIRILSHFKSFRDSDNNNRNALFYAALNSQVANINYLIDKKVRIDQFDNDFDTTLTYLIKNTCNHDIILLLIRNGASILFYDVFNAVKCGDLLDKMERERQGSVTRCYDVNGNDLPRALMIYVNEIIINNVVLDAYKPTIVKIFNMNFDFNLLNKFNKNITHVALEVQCLFIIELICVTHREFIGEITQYYINNSNIEEINHFLQYEPDLNEEFYVDMYRNPFSDKYTLLVNAIINSTSSVVEILLKRGSDPNLYSKLHGKYPVDYLNRKDIKELNEKRDILIKHGARTIEYDIENCGLKNPVLIGSGSYGNVYECEKGMRKIALKYFRSNLITQRIGLKDELMEIDLLSIIHNPYIISRIGLSSSYSCNLRGIGIQLPLGQMSLYKYIRVNQIDSFNKLMILYKIAIGLAFLHSIRILHLDVKEPNIVMLDGDPKIIDFGLSRNFDDKINYMCYTVDRRPPEAFSRVVSDKSDVWAYGRIVEKMFVNKLDEMLSPDKNYANEIYYSRLNKILNVSTSKLRTLLVSGNESVDNLLINILAWKPEDRYSMKQVLDSQVFYNLDINRPLSFINMSIIDSNPEVDANVLFNLMPDCKIRTKLNAFDLLFRYRSLSKSIDEIDYHTCCKIACILNNEKFPSSIDIIEIIDRIKLKEVEIVQRVNGQLSTMTLYRLCKTEDQVSYLYNQIATGKIDYNKFTIRPDLFEQIIVNIR